MKKILIITFIITLSMLFFSCVTIDTFPNGLGEELQEPENLKEIIDNGETAIVDNEYSQYVIIDVRPSGAYEDGYIPTAINIKNGDTESYDNPPPKDAYIIVYCETGGRAESAANSMLDNGYQYLLNWGSYKKWGDAGYEYETD